MMTKVGAGKHHNTFLHKISDREEITEKLLSGEIVWLENLRGFRYISKHDRMGFLKEYLEFNKLISDHNIHTRRYSVYRISIAFGFAGVCYNKGSILEYAPDDVSNRNSGLYLLNEE